MSRCLRHISSCHRTLRPSLRSWRASQAFLSSTVPRRSLDVEELIELEPTWEKNKKHFEAQADDGLLDMIQYQNAWLRFKEDLKEELEKSNLLQDVDDVGVQRHYNKLMEALQTQEVTILESREHALDILHQKYPSLDPYPFREYRNDWLGRKRAEQEEEYERLNNEILSGDETIDMLHDKINDMLVKQYGQEIIDRENMAYSNNFAGNFDGDYDEEHQELSADSVESEAEADEPSDGRQVGFGLKQRSSSDPVTSVKHDGRSKGKESVVGLSLEEQLRRLTTFGP